jgi:hypothetical protein
MNVNNEIVSTTKLITSPLYKAVNDLNDIAECMAVLEAVDIAGYTSVYLAINDALDVEVGYERN